MKISTEKVE